MDARRSEGDRVAGGAAAVDGAPGGGGDGGMIAGLVPTGLSLPEAQDVMMRALFAQLFAQRAPTLGEAILRAKQQMPADADTMREVIETFVLLGDPALVNPFVSK